MQTALRLDDDLYRQVKARAATLGISLTQFLVEALRERLQAPVPTPRARRIHRPVSSATGGLVAGFATLDACLAAAAKESRYRLISQNQGFSRFHGLDWWAPAGDR